MPRPAHYRQREKAIAEGSKDPAAVDDAGSTSTVRVDEPSRSDQSSSRTGDILPEGTSAEVAQSVARLMGWAPKDEWKRDPAKWQDAETFLREQPQRLETLRERHRGVSRAAELALAEERERIREEAMREVREAAEAKDGDRAVKASEKLASTSGPLPQTVAWVGKNPWFNTDPIAEAAARAEILRRASNKETVEEQLEGAEALIRRRFPEHFRADPKPDREDPAERRLSDIPRRDPPMQAEGQRGGSGNLRRADREPTWSEIPSADRGQMGIFVKKMTMRDKTMTVEAAQKRLAASYWNNKG